VTASSRPGPRSRALHAAERELIAPGIQRIAQLSELTLESGSGCTVVDVDGNEYLDFFAGVAVASLGHAHPRFVAALTEQLQGLVVGSFTSEVRLRLVKLLASLAPGQLSRTQLYSGGAEAVEAAIRLAKAYTKKHEVVGFWGGFHGKTGGVIGLIGDEWKQGWGPLPGGTYQVPYADCYRCPFKLTYPDCGMYCLDFVRQSLKVTTGGAIAAILIEPMQGTAGNVVPPPEFLPGVRDIAREHDALLIADELITGLGRTGRTFGCEHTGVEPDIMTLGKGLGNGFPVSGLMSTDEITTARPFANASASSSSYGGNPLAAAAARVTVETIIEDGLVDHSRRLGETMLAEMQRWEETIPIVSDVRGRGLMLGFDLVQPGTKTLLDKTVTRRIFHDLLERGVIAMIYNPEVRINPPLVIGEEQAMEALATMREVLRDTAQRISA
jgi:4-aminobutyrate aminotransferase / (S)-3-amino-2-methylpropionate transaminase / 5-aminovalerate transaminase